MNKQDFKISVICVFNNMDQFEKQLNKSLKQQDVDYELIAIDNSNNKFSSASQALNYGSEKAKGDILVFSHQDIFLKRNLRKKYQWSQMWLAVSV